MHLEENLRMLDIPHVQGSMHISAVLGTAIILRKVFKHLNFLYIIYLFIELSVCMSDMRANERGVFLTIYIYIFFFYLSILLDYFYINLLIIYCYWVY